MFPGGIEAERTTPQPIVLPGNEASISSGMYRARMIEEGS